MKLRLRRTKTRATLMLTSLLDMFTIILIFLIVSFEAEDYDFRIAPDLTLPESSAQSLFKPAVNVAVSRAGVRVQQELVYPFQNGEAAADDYADEQIPAVVEALEKVLAARQSLGVGDETGEDIIVFQADRLLPYRTLYLVMRSARLAGFSKYRLAIIKE